MNKVQTDWKFGRCSPNGGSELGHVGVEVDFLVAPGVLFQPAIVEGFHECMSDRAIHMLRGVFTVFQKPETYQ